MISNPQFPGPDNLSGDKAKRLFLMGKHLGTFVFYFSTWSTKPFDSDGLDISQLRSEALSIFGQAKALINSKCSLSACETGKMALPSELEYFIYLHQDYEYPLDSVVLGTDPNQVRPLYLGDPGQGGVRLTLAFVSSLHRWTSTSPMQTTTRLGSFIWTQTERRAISALVQRTRLLLF